MADDLVITESGKKKIEEELTQLRDVEMPALSDRIREARALGDLSENFDYQDSKRQQGFINGRIASLQAILDRSRVVADGMGGSDTAGMGSTVTLRDLDYDEELAYTLVGIGEDEPDKGKISVTSPVGKALMGRKVGDSVEVTTPGGKSSFEVVAVA